MKTVYCVFFRPNATLEMPAGKEDTVAIHVRLLTSIHETREGALTTMDKLANKSTGHYTLEAWVVSE